MMIVDGRGSKTVRYVSREQADRLGTNSLAYCWQVEPQRMMTIHKVGIVAHTCNPSTSGEAGES